MAATLGAANPFRYRSYYWDSEIGLYYLMSRYYNPEWGRFINADTPELLELSAINVVAANLFAYCCNNPINYMDPTGHYAETLRYIPSLMDTLKDALPFIIGGVASAMAGIKSAIVTSWLPIVCITAALVAVAGISYTIYKVCSLTSAAASTISNVKAKVKAEGLDQKKLRGNTVYVITRIDTTDVVYVGRTTNYAARMSRHEKRFPKNKYTKYPIATGLSLSAARALEQAIITAYCIDTLGNMVKLKDSPLDNKINSIAKSKWNNFKSEFEQMQTLIESWHDPE